MNRRPSFGDQHNLPRWLRAFLALGFAAHALAAPAAMIPCAATNDGGLKLLLDDLVSSGGDETVMRALVTRVDAGIQQIELETASKTGTQPPTSSSVRVRSKRCPGRRPGTGSDFDEPTVRELNNRQVVIEVWGTSSSAGAAGGGQLAVISYALVSVRQTASEDRAPSIVEVSRQIRNPNQVDDLLLVLDQSGRLAAYTAASTGVRLVNERNNWDGARAQLCVAQSRLEKLDDGSPDDQLLLSFVKQLAADVIVQAQNDTTYHGPLKLFSAVPCPLRP